MRKRSPNHTNAAYACPGHATQAFTQHCRFAIAGIVLLLALSGCQASTATSLDRTSDQHPQSSKRVLGEYVVELASPQASSKQLHQVFGDLGIRSIKALQISGAYYLIRLQHDPGPQAMNQRARHSGLVQLVQPNHTYSNKGGTKNKATNPPRKPAQQKTTLPGKYRRDSLSRQESGPRE